MRLRVPVPYRGNVTAARRPSLLASPIADVALGVLAAGTVAAAAAHIEPTGSERALDGLAYACMAVAGGGLAGRRRWPLAVVAVVTTALGVYLARGYPGGPVFVTLFVALYSLASGRGRRLAFPVAAVAAGGLVVVGEVFHTGPGLVHLVFVGWAAAAVFLGDAIRSRRSYLAALEERARHLEQSREEEARRRVAEERLRIAQDLHDSVAHTMATINVQAGVAAHVIDRHPDKAREALVVIQQASREVLDELAALLGLLRPGGRDGEGDTGNASLAPTPGPSQLGGLVESVRRSGLQVTLTMDRDPGDVPQPVGVAVYRIVQESLTNVLRHAGPGAAATVTITSNSDGDLTVEIADNGRGHNGNGGNGHGGTGVGIVGMRERAQATGGALSAGARPQGGWVVRGVWAKHP
jgi:signal transduction histidine kinase